MSLFSLIYFCDPELRNKDCDKKLSCGRNINNFRKEDYEGSEINLIHKCLDHNFFFVLEHSNTEIIKDKEN